MANKADQLDCLWAAASLTFVSDGDHIRPLTAGIRRSQFTSPEEKQILLDYLKAVCNPAALAPPPPVGAVGAPADSEEIQLLKLEILRAWHVVFVAKVRALEAAEKRDPEMVRTLERLRNSVRSFQERLDRIEQRIRNHGDVVAEDADVVIEVSGGLLQNLDNILKGVEQQRSERFAKGRGYRVDWTNGTVEFDDPVDFDVFQSELEKWAKNYPPSETSRAFKARLSSVGRKAAQRRAEAAEREAIDQEIEAADLISRLATQGFMHLEIAALDKGVVEEFIVTGWNPTTFRADALHAAGDAIGAISRLGVVTPRSVRTARRLFVSVRKRFEQIEQNIMSRLGYLQTVGTVLNVISVISLLIPLGAAAAGAATAIRGAAAAARAVLSGGRIALAGGGTVTTGGAVAATGAVLTPAQIKLLLYGGVATGTAGVAINAAAKFARGRSSPGSGGGSGRPASDPNKIRHIFDKLEHGLEPLVRQFRSKSAAYEALKAATQKVVTSRELTGLYKVIVEVGGLKVTVRGRVIDGVARIGTAYIR